MFFLETLLFPHVLQSVMRIGWPILLWVLALARGAATHAEATYQDSPPEPSGAREAGSQEASASPAPFRFEPGADVPTVLIPRAETLVYNAYLEAGIASANVGTVTQTCTVSEQPSSILLTQPAGPAGETASIKLFATGSYLFYDFESTLETRVFPQEWPRISYNSISKGSQTRRREVLLGTKDGKTTSSYRGDTSKGAPGDIRIWRPAKERVIPAGTLDLLSAVFQARTLIREGKEALSFPLIDKDRLWNLTLRRGEERRMELGAGTFDVIEVVLEPVPYEGEAFAEKAARFEGVFGIQGSIHLWVEKKSGVTVRIQGVLPVGKDDGIFKVGIDVTLDSYSGTPADFAPVPAANAKKKE